MKESRQKQLLQGQSSQARKIFEAVPIAEPWSESTINKTMTLTGAQPIANHTLRACLRDMRDAGLIREPRVGFFQRMPVTRNTPTPNQTEAKETMSSQSSNAGTTVATEQALAVAVIEKAEKPTAASMLLALTIQVTEVHATFSKAMTDLAEQLEAVAGQVEEEQASNAEALANLDKLRALLKGL